MLKPLLLPQLVEERRKRESLQDLTISNDLETAISGYSNHSSIPSSPTSPNSPTFSMHGHLRYSSSTSSLDASLQLPTTEALVSPTVAIVRVKASKRSLPDVQEEPHDDQEEKYIDYNILTKDELYDCLCDRDCIHRNTDAVQSSLQLSTLSAYDFNLNDGFFSDGDIEPNYRPKKRREAESQFSAMAARLGSRFPSLSRKWRVRKETSPIPSPVMAGGVFGTATTSRSSSISVPEYRMDFTQDIQTPPTPTKSIFEEVVSTHPHGSEVEKIYLDNVERLEHLASTPLLPPLMTDAATNNLQCVQSPLQSPSVADIGDLFTQSVLSIDTITTPVFSGTPSPPLSSKPSTSSFHHVNLGRLVPTSDIPPMLIADEHDEWAIKLGHANFVVAPKPYLPAIFDIEACRQLRADWELARTNYTKHLVRTGEHYGVTSNTYALTEEKWQQTDAAWKRNNDITIQNTVDNDGDAFSTLKHTTFGSEPNNTMTKIPSLNDPKGQGKFPELGDQEIVGPMIQVAGQLHRTPSKKTKIMRFFVEKFPGSALSRP